MICLGIHEAPMTENGDDSRVVNFPSFVFSNKGYAAMKDVVDGIDLASLLAEDYQKLVHEPIVQFFEKPYSKLPFVGIVTGFNRVRANKDVERLFEVQYEIQNGEECESGEQLTYSQVQQGRYWYKIFNRDRMIKNREEQNLKQWKIKDNSLKIYDRMMQDSDLDDGDLDDDNCEPTKNNHMQTTPIGGSSGDSSRSSSMNKTMSHRNNSSVVLSPPPLLLLLLLIFLLLLFPGPSHI